jgi:hypothetical protein
MSKLEVNSITAASSGAKVDFPDGITVGGDGLVTPNDYKKSVGLQDARNNNSVVGIAQEQCSILTIRDSFGDGVGASEYIKSCGWMFSRSLCNANDGGFGNERGYGYHSTLNWTNLLSTNMFDSTGDVVEEGVILSQLRLSAGQTLTITGFALDYLDFMVNGKGVASTLEFRRNGSLYRTKSVGAGTGFATTFDGTKVRSDGMLSADSDVFVITCTSGSIQLICALQWRTAGYSPAIYHASRGGTTYSDYVSAAALDEMANILKFARDGQVKVLNLGLGTNSIYNPSKYQTPTEMLTSIVAIIQGMNARAGGVKYVLHVPAKAGTVWPYICPGFTWEDYRDALIDFAFANGIALVRHDLSVLGTGDAAYLSNDGLHLNNYGHSVDHANWCETYAVPPDSSMRGPGVAYSLPADLGVAAGGAAGVWTPVFTTSNGNAAAYGIRNAAWTKDAQGWVTATWDVVGNFAGAVPPASSFLQISGLPFTPQANYEGSGWVSFVTGAALPAGTVNIGAAVTGTGVINVACTLAAGGQFGYIDASTTDTAQGVRINGGVRFKAA